MRAFFATLGAGWLTTLATLEAQHEHPQTVQVEVVPREPERTLREAWDAEAMALEHPDATPALDAEDAVNVLEKQLRHPRPR